jgi:hypothetical protein
VLGKSAIDGEEWTNCKLTEARLRALLQPFGNSRVKAVLRKAGSPNWLFGFQARI